EFMLELDQGMVVARDVTGAARAGPGAGRGLDHGADHLGVLAHAEIVVGAPHHDAALALRGMPGGERETAGDTLKIGEYAIAAFVTQPDQGIVEELIVIHTKNPTEPMDEKASTKGATVLDAFLERFQLRC